MDHLTQIKINIYDFSICSQIKKNTRQKRLFSLEWKPVILDFCFSFVNIHFGLTEDFFLHQTNSSAKDNRIIKRNESERFTLKKGQQGAVLRSISLTELDARSFK